MWIRLLLGVLFATFLTPAAAFAQRSAQLCMPQAPVAHRQSFAVELRARGYDVLETCDDAQADVWLLRLEVPGDLADVWIVATREGHAPRRVRVAGPMDTVDAHVLALSGASLLDEEEPVPTVALDPPEPPSPAAPRTVNEVEPRAAAPNPEDDGPVELVRSSRSIGSSLVLEFGAAAGLITGGQGTVGGAVGLAIPLAPWFRLRLPLHFQIWPDRVWEFGSGLAADFILPLVPSETWLELGFAARFQLRVHASVLRADPLLGGDLHVALFQRISDSFRFFARAEAMALADVGETVEPDYGLYFSSGFAVIF